MATKRPDPNTPEQLAATARNLHDLDASAWLVIAAGSDAWLWTGRWRAFGWTDVLIDHRTDDDSTVAVAMPGQGRATIDTTVRMHVDTTPDRADAVLDAVVGPEHRTDLYAVTVEPVDDGVTVIWSGVSSPV